MIALMSQLPTRPLLSDKVDRRYLALLVTSSSSLISQDTNMTLFSKLLLASAMLPLSVSALAGDGEPKIDKDTRCIFIAHTYNNALTARNAGLPPENALAMADFKELPLQLRKNIINQVYFDKNLKYASPSKDLVWELLQYCLHGAPTPFEPLK